MEMDPHRNDSHSEMASFLTLDRREFFKRLGILGGGIIVYFTVGDSAAWSAPPPMPPDNTPRDFNAFLRIGTDERVTCFVGKIDMGQGTITSFPQIVAEELDVAYESIDMIMGDTDLCPWDFGTVCRNSQSVPGPAHTSFQNCSDIQLTPDFACVEILALKCKRGTMCHDSQGRHLRESIDQFL